MFGRQEVAAALLVLISGAGCASQAAEALDPAHQGIAEPDAIEIGLPPATTSPEATSFRPLVATASARPAGEQPPVAWRKDADSAMADAKRKGRPLLVYVRAEWCVSCLELERSWASEPAFERATRSFIPLWVEASDDEALTDVSVRFGALPVPSIALIDAKTGRRSLLDSRALLDHAADSVLAFLSEE